MFPKPPAMFPKPAAKFPKLTARFILSTAKIVRAARRFIYLVAPKPKPFVRPAKTKGICFCNKSRCPKPLEKLFAG
jgi:hypothetical protein